MDTDTFIKRAQDIHKDSEGNPLYDYSLTDYQGAQKKVKIICPKHRQEWKDTTGNEYFEVTANHHLSGRRCKFDYKESITKYSDKDIEDAAKKYKHAIEFKRAEPELWNAATKRGKEFYKKISSHFVPLKESAGEKYLAQVLFNMGLIPEDCTIKRTCSYREKSFADCTNQGTGAKVCRRLRFDFYLPEQNTLIEYDGEQHFVKRGKFGEGFEQLKKNDRIKSEYCKKNNIKLIRIHHRLPENEIESKLSDALKSNDQLTLIGPY